jgi:hypothetical protein|tara:strand:- start:1813 stop:2931 length:1119 start_codon:yes stop_codon:yes gene_type:complete
MSSLSSRAKLRESLHLRDAFVSSGIPARGVANATAFTVAQEWLRERDYVEHLRVSGRVLDESDGMDPNAVPFDAILRLASGRTPNLVDQSALGDWADEFMICHNNVEFDQRWDLATSGTTGALAGPDRHVGGLPGHVVMTTKETVCGKSNVAALALSGEDEDRREAVQFLMRMREAAMTYARWRGWTQLGLYFRFFGCEPEGEEERGIIRLHVVNLARAGPRLRKTSRNNLPIDDVIEALGGLRASRRGSVLLVSPVEGRESVTPRSFESTAAPWVDSKDVDDEVEVAIKRVVVQSAPLIENDIVIPEKIRDEYASLSSSSNVQAATRHAFEEQDGEKNDKEQLFDDAQWLSAYKKLSSPARVQRALSEIQL